MIGHSLRLFFYLSIYSLFVYPSFYSSICPSIHPPINPSFSIHPSSILKFKYKSKWKNKVILFWKKIWLVNFFDNKIWLRHLGLSDPIRSVAQLCPTLCDPMNRSMPGLPVHHQLPEFTETHVHRVSDAILPSHPLSSPSPPAPNPFQHQSLFHWVNSSHEVAQVLEFQL